MNEINWNLFSYEEVIEILKDRNNVLHELMVAIFGDIESYEEDELVLCYGESCAELDEGQYFLVNFKNEYAYTLNNNEQNYIQTFIERQGE